MQKLGKFEKSPKIGPLPKSLCGKFVLILTDILHVDIKGLNDWGPVGFTVFSLQQAPSWKV